MPLQQDEGHLASELFKGALKMGSFVGRQALSRAVKSDFAKNKIKGIANNYLDQALDSFTSDISKKISPIGKGIAYDMSMYTDTSDPTNPLYDRSQYGQGVDIHKLIGKLPRPKGGWTPGSYKYMGPYNPLADQLSYNTDTGEVINWKVHPKNELDKISAYHDICYDRGRDKGDCDKKMVKAIDQIPWKDKPWGSTAVRNLINIKQKAGLGLKPKKKPKKKPKNGKRC